MVARTSVGGAFGGRIAGMLSPAPIFGISIKNNMAKAKQTSAKTDEMIEDDRGLKVKGRLAMGTQRGREVHELMKMGALDGLSIGFRIAEKGQEYDKRGKRRYIKEVDLMEISAVTFPMNPKARVQMVKGEERTVREWEEIMRDAGSLSRNEAKVAATAVTKALSNRDDCSEEKPEIMSSIQNLTNILKPKTTE